jgi:hypothetical protein
MRLFLYGTLLDADTLTARGGDAGLPALLAPATLHGWRCAAGATDLGARTRRRRAWRTARRSGALAGAPCRL